MPIIEFRCTQCNYTFDKLFWFPEVKDEMYEACPRCGKDTPRILFSRTLEPHFYGNPDGYSAPSPTKRYSTKLVAQSGNDSAVG